MIHNLLKNKKIILASQSPRRKKIFDFLKIKYLQIPANIDEKTNYKSPRLIVKNNSKKKVKAISEGMDPECIIIGADTIVYKDKKILEKPIDKFQAAEFLTNLSGDYHYVYTGLTINYQNKYITEYTKSKVEFYDLTASEIEEYINTKEPMDKAGAYGVQGLGSQFIKKISGCYFNVMGFPVSLFYQVLKDML